MSDLTPLQRQQMAEVERMRAEQAPEPVEIIRPTREPRRAAEPVEATPEPVTPTPGVVAKNPTTAVILSFFIPGVGHFYAGSAVGLVFLLLHIFNWTAVLLTIGFPPAAFIGLFIWIGGMKYSYRAAQDFNQRNGLTVK